MMPGMPQLPPIHQRVDAWPTEAIEGPQRPVLERYHYGFVALFFLAGAAAAFGPRPEGLSVEGQRAIGIFVLCGGLWLSGVIPLHITSMLAIVLLPMLGIMSGEDAFALFGNKAVFFILGAFVLSAVLVECGLSTRVSCIVFEYGAKSPRRLRTVILLFTAFSSFWMSEHAVAAMTFPIVMSVVKALGLEPKKSRFAKSFFFALAWGCVIGGIATYLGGARNPLAVGILSANTGVTISFMRWLTASLPMVVVLLVVALAVLRRHFPEEAVDMAAARARLHEMRDRFGPLTRREIGIAVVTILTILAWVFLYDFLGLAPTALAAVAALFIFRLTKWEAVEEGVNWGIILMYGGAIALGSALSETGAAAWFVNITLGGHQIPPFALIVIVGTMSLALTEVISNAAVVSIMMPVAIGLAASQRIPYEVMAFAIALPSGLSYILPMGTPATAIIYGSGYLEVRDFARMGTLMAGFSLLVFALTARLWWPLIGFGY